MPGPIGLPGHNGSQGPAGPVGPQGPKGAGDFSACQYNVVKDSVLPGGQIKAAVSRIEPTVSTFMFSVYVFIIVNSIYCFPLQINLLIYKLTIHRADTYISSFRSDEFEVSEKFHLQYFRQFHAMVVAVHVQVLKLLSRTLVLLKT